MPRNVKLSRLFLIAMTTGFLLTPSLVFAATASTTPVTAQINSGLLSITPPTSISNFPNVTLNGQVQQVYDTLSNWNVTDATGTGDGWNVTLGASQFTEITPSTGFASGTVAKTLPSGSLGLSGVRSVTAASNALPVDPTGGPLIKNAGSVIDTGSPVQVIQTDQNYGMGSYTVNEPTNGLLLTLDPGTTDVDPVNYPSQPTPYSSTLTYTVSSGPTPNNEPTSLSGVPLVSGMSWSTTYTSGYYASGIWNSNAYSPPNGVPLVFSSVVYDATSSLIVAAYIDDVGELYVDGVPEYYFGTANSTASVTVTPGYHNVQFFAENTDGENPVTTSPANPAGLTATVKDGNGVVLSSTSSPSSWNVQQGTSPYQFGGTTQGIGPWVPADANPSATSGNPIGPSTLPQ